MWGGFSGYHVDIYGKGKPENLFTLHPEFAIPGKLNLQN